MADTVFPTKEWKWPAVDQNIAYLPCADLNRLVGDRDELLAALGDRLCCRSGSATECNDCFNDRALIDRIKAGKP